MAGTAERQQQILNLKIQLRDADEKLYLLICTFENMGMRSDVGEHLVDLREQVFRGCNRFLDARMRDLEQEEQEYWNNVRKGR